MKRELTCPACQRVTTTGASPGRTVACKACGAELRVPLREASVGQELECPTCGQRFETAAQPGRRTRCKHCGADVRVALRDASETLPAGTAGRRERPPVVIDMSNPFKRANPGAPLPPVPIPTGVIGGMLLVLSAADAASMLVRGHVPPAEQKGALLVGVVGLLLTVHGAISRARAR